MEILTDILPNDGEPVQVDMHSIVVPEAKRNPPDQSVLLDFGHRNEVGLVGAAARKLV